ncbi:MAG: histidinol-phosphate transaminase [Firmicutes bacterium]|nr:histidinol-phosphate transaminase [Bacillota bacterium]
MTANAIRIRLDSNESPFDLPAPLKARILGELRTIPFNRYPQGLASTLRQTIASRMGVDDTQVTLGNGLDEVIHIILQTFGPGRRVIAQKPSFVMYEVAALAAGASYRGVALGEGLKLGVTEIIEEANSEAGSGLGIDPPVVILCNPHNPTGGRLSEAEIETVLRATQALIVVDEAYIEFAGGSVLPLLAKYDRLVVLRTMSKAFGLAGVRVGYSVSSPRVAAELAKVKQPFNLDSLALVVAQMALQDDAYYQEAVARIVEERAWLAQRLSCIPGITCLPSCTNFILFRTESAEAAEVHDTLRRQGISVRIFPDEPMLRGYLRVSCGTREEDDEFLAALENVVRDSRLAGYSGVKECDSHVRP